MVVAIDLADWVSAFLAGAFTLKCGPWHIVRIKYDLFYGVTCYGDSRLPTGDSSVSYQTRLEAPRRTCKKRS